MPRNKKYGRIRKRYRRTGRFLRKRYRRAKGGRIKTRKGGMLVSDRFKVKLKYSLLISGNTDASGDYTYVFSGNSAYDPDVSGVGFQPTGWDQYSALYRFYYVSGSKLRFQVINQSTTDVIKVGCFPATQQLSSGDLATMDPAEWPYSRWALLGPTSSSRSVKDIKSYMSTKKVYGYRTSTNPNFISAISANPTNQWYWNIWVTTLVGTSPGFTLSCTMTYYVNFFGRQEIAWS